MRQDSQLAQQSHRFDLDSMHVWEEEEEDSDSLELT